jgi:tetratricopeptide (TPR) repeat protein
LAYTGTAGGQESRLVFQSVENLPTYDTAADQVLVFQRGSSKDKAVLAYTLLKHLGQDPSAILTETDGYIELNGKQYNVHTGRSEKIPDEDIVFRLKAIEQFPGLAQARRQARDMVMGGNIPGAIEALEKAAVTYPKSWQIQDDLWFTCDRLNQTENARRHLEKSNILDPDNPDRLNQLAWIALEQSDLDLAIRYCRRGLELEPENGYLKSTLVQGLI